MPAFRDPRSRGYVFSDPGADKAFERFFDLLVRGIAEVLALMDKLSQKRRSPIPGQSVIPLAAP